jgi:hypothetical protein
MLKIRGPKRAEPLVRLLAKHKTDVLAALAPAAEAQWWRRRFTTRTFQWSNGSRTWREVQRLAWGDLQNEWHARHGHRTPAWQCAGCEKPISGAEALDLLDGNRVHLEPIDCLIAFGRRWRGDADAALVALGLSQPIFAIW